MCPGRRFARTEIKAVICSLIVHYNMRWADSDNIPEPPIDHDTFVNAIMPLHDVKFEISKKQHKE